MNSTLELLTTAARQLEIPFSFVNGATHLIQFDFGSKPYYFCWGTHPFESMVKSNIFKNKALCQELLEDIVQMPPSRTFYKNEASTKEILAKAEALFGYPLIVKPCNGTLARNVRFCNNAKEAEKAVNAIFYNNTDADLNTEIEEELLIQQYIDNKKEYRMVYLYGEVVLIYHRDYIFDEEGKLKKIKIVIEEDKVLEQKFLQFVQPVIDKLNISYTGFDLFVKDDGDCYLIELNAYPLFKVISEHNYQAAVDVFKKILTLFKSKAENRLI